MDIFKCMFFIFPFLLVAQLLLFITHCEAARFDIRNNCPYTVWAASTPVGGGRQLNRGETWTIDVPAGTKAARIWARTNCNFDGSGRGKCQTGDCNGLLDCRSSGQPPMTIAEYSLNQYNNLDFIDISVIDGFNVPLEFSPTSNGCTSGIRCTGDINERCPSELRAPGGYCYNPCNVYKRDEFCCYSGKCSPTPLSKFFKDRCPDAYTYPKDDTSNKSCPGGTNYRVVFCP